MDTLFAFTLFCEFDRWNDFTHKQFTGWFSLILVPSVWIIICQLLKKSLPRVFVCVPYSYVIALSQLFVIWDAIEVYILICRFVWAQQVRISNFTLKTWHNAFLLTPKCQSWICIPGSKLQRPHAVKSMAHYQCCTFPLKINWDAMYIYIYIYTAILKLCLNKMKAIYIHNMYIVIYSCTSLHIYAEIWKCEVHPAICWSFKKINKLVLIQLGMVTCLLCTHFRHLSKFF